MDGYGYAAEAIVKVGADTAQAERGLTTVSGQINSLSGLGASAGRALNQGLTIGATAIAGIASASVGAAISFDQYMRNVNSIAQLSESAFQDMRAEILDFSLTTRSGADNVARALYDVASAGMSLDEAMGTFEFRGRQLSEGMIVLQAASSAAGAGLADVKDVTSLIISAMGAYNVEADQVARITDVFLHTVKEGLTTLPALAGTLGRILPTAANLGISLEEVGFAMARMTKTGLSTEEAATRLNNVMLSLIKPSEAMDEVLGRLGVTSGTALVEKMGGLMGAISAITKTEFENIIATGGMSEAQAKMAEDLPYLQRELVIAREELAKMESATRPNTTAIERKRIAIEKLSDKISDYESELAKVVPLTETMTTTTYNSNEALAEIFNNVRSLGGALALMADDTTLSAEALQEFSAAADGALERMRAEQYKSFSAQLGLLKSSLKVISIEIGTRMLPALTSFVTAIRKFVQQYGPPLLDFLDRTMEGFDRMSEPVRTIVGLFGGLFIASRSLNTVLRAVSPMLGMIGISIGTISTPILALIGGVALLAKAWRSNWLGIGDALNGFVRTGQSFFRYIGAVLEDGDTLNDWLTELPEKWRGAAQGVGEFVSNGQSFLRYISAVLEDGDTLNDWLTNLPEQWRGAAQGVGEAISGMRTVLSGIWEGLTTGDWDAVKGRIKYGWLRVIDGVREAFEGSRENVIAWASGLWQRVVTWWTEGGGQEWAQGVADGIRTALASVPGMLGDAVEGAREWLVSTWTATRTWWDEGGQEWAAGVAGDIKNALDSVPGLLLDAGMTAGQWLVGVWERISTWWDESGQQWASDTAGKIGDGIQKLQDTLTSDQVPGWVSAAVKWLEPIWLGMADWWEEEAAPLTTMMATGFSNWLNGKLVPALKNTDSTTWAQGVGQVLMSGIEEGIKTLYTPEVSAQVAHAITRFFAKALGDAVGMMVELPMGIGQALVNMIFGGEGGEEVDLSPAVNWFKTVAGSALDGLRQGFEESKAGQYIVGFFERWLEAINVVLGTPGPSAVFQQIGADVVLGIKAGVEEKFTEVKAAIETGFNDAKTKAGEFVDDFFAVGADLVAGIVAGITSKITEIAEAAASVVRAAIAAARRAGIMRSPSQAMREVGWDWVLGLIVGIQDQQPEAVKAATDVINSIGQAASSIVRGLSDLSDYRFAVIDFATINRQIRAVVANFRDLNEYFAANGGNGLTAAKAVLDPLGDIFSKLGSVLGTMRSLADQPLPENLGQVVSQTVSLLTGAVPALVAGLANLSTLISFNQSVTAATVGAAVASATSAASDIVQSMAILSAGAPRVNITSVVSTLQDSVPPLIAALAGLADDIGQASQAGSVAQALADAIAPWGEITGVLEKIAAVSQLWPRLIVPAADRLKWTVFVLVGMTTWLAGALDSDVLSAAANTADRLALALSPWQAMADAVLAVAETAEYPSRVIVPVADRLKWTAFVLINSVDWLAGELDDTVLATAAAVANKIDVALSPWQAMADAVLAVAETAEYPSRVIVPVADRLKWTAFVLIGMVDWLAGELDGRLATAAALADQIVTAMSPWRAMADAVSAVADVVEVDAGPAADRLIEAIVQMTRSLLRLTSAGSEGFGLTDADLQGAANTALKLVEILQPWREAAETLTAVASVVGRGAGAAIDHLAGFMDQLTRALLLLVDTGSEGGGLTEAALLKAGRVAALLMDTLAPWETAMKVASEMRAFVLMPGFVDKMTRFARQWAEIIDQISRIVLDLSRDGLQAVQQFGSALNALTTGMIAAMNLATSGAWPEPNAGQWTGFVDWVSGVFQTFYDLVQDIVLDPDNTIGFDPVLTFAGVLEALMQALNAAAGFLRDFQFTPPDPDLWSGFVGWVWGVFQTFHGLVQGLLTDPDNVIGIDPVATFAGALSTLLGALQGSLGLVRDFQFTPPDPDLWSGFVGWVWGVFQTFYGLVQGLLTDPDNVIGFDPVAGFGSALTSVMGALQAGVDLVRNFQFTPPDADLWSGFVSWVWGIFQTFYGLVQDLVEDPENVIGFDPVAGFGSALGAVMGGLMEALNLVANFAWVSPDPDLWSGFVGWVWGVFQTFYGLVQDLVEDPDNVMGFDPVAEFGNALGAVMGGLTAAVNLITSFVWVAPDPQIWDNFITWVLGFMSDLRARIQTTFPDSASSAATFEPVAAFGNAISAVMGGLQGALEFLSGLAGFIPPASDLVTVFLDNVLIMVDQIGAYTQNHIDPARLLAVSRFSQALQDLTGGLSGALSLFDGLASLDDRTIDWLTNAGAGTGTNTGAAMQTLGYLFMAIVETMQRFHTEVVTQAGTNWIPAAQAFSAAMQSVVGILQSALNLFTDLGSSGMPNTTQIAAFVQAIMQVFTGFNTGLASTLGPLTTTINAIRDELHVRLYGHLAYVGAPQPGRLYYDVGVNIVRSIGAGMLSQSNYIYQVAYDIGQTILAGLNAALGINSPSRAGLYAGAMTGEGLALGILNSATQVRSAARVLADVATDELAKIPARVDLPSPLWPDLGAVGPRMAPVVTVEHVLKMKLEGGDRLPKMSDFEMREFARELGRHIRIGG